MDPKTEEEPPSHDQTITLSPAPKKEARPQARLDGWITFLTHSWRDEHGRDSVAIPGYN